MRDTLNFAPAADAARFLKFYTSHSWTAGQAVCRTPSLKRILTHRCNYTLCSGDSFRPANHSDDSASITLPRVYPVTTETSSGLGFEVAPGFIATCDHVVSRKGSIRVAGADATIVSSCPADISLLYVPALSKKPVQQFTADVRNQFVHETFQSHKLLVVGPRRNSIQATMGAACMMLYKSSGAYLPSLRICLLDVARKKQSTVEHGWSGSPVICNDSWKVVGMVAHGDFENTTGHSVLAVPGRVIEWFLSRCEAVKVKAPQPRWIPMGTIAHVTAQTLTGKASRVGAEMQIGGTALLSPGVGVRIARVNTRSELRVNDIILKVNDMDVYSDGCVMWMGLRVGYQTAFLELQPGQKSSVQVVRRGKSGGGEVLNVLISIDSAERGTLGIPIRGRGIAVEAGKREVRLVELSIELLERWYGSSWQMECGLDLHRTAVGEFEYSDDALPGQEHIVVDPSFFGSDIDATRAGDNCDVSDDWGWNEMKGMRVHRVDGERVYKLEDIMRISDKQSTNAPLIVELYPGFTAAMPMPLKMVHDTNE
jgi:hypothetical protein